MVQYADISSLSEGNDKGRNGNLTARNGADIRMVKL